MLSFIAAAGGAVVGVKLASKGKRDDGNEDAALARLDNGVREVGTKLENVLNGVNRLTSSMESQVNPGSVNALDEKLTNLEATSEKEIHELSSILESTTNLRSKIDTVSTNLKTVEQHIVKLEDMMTKRAMEEKEDIPKEQTFFSSDKIVKDCNNQSRPIIIDTCAIVDVRVIKMLESGVWEELRGAVVITDLLRKELIRMENQGDRIRGDGNLEKLHDNNNIQNSIEHEDIIKSYDNQAMDERISQLASDTDEEILQDLPNKVDKNDKKFLLFTSDTNGILITTDYDLARLCRVMNVWVLHLDELYETIKPEVKPGYKSEVYLKEKSANQSFPDDAIAHHDGILIFVKGGAKFIGDVKLVEIISGPRPSTNGKGFTAIAKILDSIAAANPPQTSPAP